MSLFLASVLLVLSLVTGSAWFFVVGAIASVPVGIVIANRRASQYEQERYAAFLRRQETRAAYGL